MLSTAFEHRLDRIALRIPSILASHRIPRMPTQGDDATTLMLSDDLLAHSIERHAVKILLAIQFELTQVETHDGRIITYGQEHVTLSLVPFPSSAIHRIVLVSEHDTLLLQNAQALHQLFRWRTTLSIRSLQSEATESPHQHSFDCHIVYIEV